MSDYTQGVCHDGAAILKDGQPLTIEQILEALRERDALAAHVQRLINTGNATDMCTFGETKEVLEWDKACNDTPPNSLARRDALKQAEALERLRLLLQETQFDKAPSVARVVMQINDAINRVKQEVRPLRLVASDYSDPHPNCELECGAYGTYCKCNAEAQQ